MVYTIVTTVSSLNIRQRGKAFLVAIMQTATLAVLAEVAGTNVQLPPQMS